MLFQEAKRQAEKQRHENTKLKEERGGLEHRVQDLERKLERAKHQQVQPISGQLVRRGGRAGPGPTVSTTTTGVDTQADGSDAGASLPLGAPLSVLPRSTADATDGLPAYQFAASSNSAPSTTSKTQQQQLARQQRSQAQPALNPALSWQTVNVNVNGSLAMSEARLGAAAVGSTGSSMARSLASGAAMRASERPRSLLGTNARALGLGPAASRSVALYDDEELQLMDPMETVAGTIDPLARHAAVTTTRRQQLQPQTQTQLQPTTELRFGSMSQSQPQPQAQQLRKGPAPQPHVNVQQNGSLRLAQAAPRQAALPNGVPASAAASTPQVKAMPAAAPGRGVQVRIDQLFALIHAASSQ